MAKAYYVAAGEAALGPFAVSELLSRDGFGPESLVLPAAESAEGRWRPAAECADFSAAFAVAELLAAPVASPAPETAAPAPRAAIPPPPPPPPPPARAARPPLVLIVDDESDVCEILKYATSKAGFRAITANSGRDAAAKIALEEPNMIVLDLMMPGQSGYEFLRDLQSAGRGDIPVSIMTARPMESSTEALIRREKNVVDFFSKPFDMPQFIASLRRRLKHAGAAPRPR
jgi:CheY-like chemotaxis protein